MWCQLFQDPDHASFLLNVNKYPEKKSVSICFLEGFEISL